MHWQCGLWCVRPEHRFVSERPGWSALTTTSAVLWIAARAPSAVVTILPARCYVADEWNLAVALHHALYERPLTVDDVVTPGDDHTESEIDEDCLTPCASVGGPTGTVPVSRSDPRSWSAEGSARRRALIASGIYIDRGAERRVPPNLAREARGTAAILGSSTVGSPASIWSKPLWLEWTALNPRDRTSRLSPTGSLCKP
jgi:hypothetical protein